MAGSRQTKGRQKITMKRIENEDDRLITFSKRRSGIYKKANELVTLCGAEVGILIFSPAGKPFSFGHPSLESIANRFLGDETSPPNDNTHPLVEAYRRVRINELNHKYNDLHNRLEDEKERGNMLKRMTKGKGKGSWWEASIDDLNLPQLQQMHTRLEKLHGKLCMKMHERSTSLPPSSNPQMTNDGPMITSLFPCNVSGDQCDFSASFHQSHGYGQQEHL